MMILEIGSISRFNRLNLEKSIMEIQY